MSDVNITDVLRKLKKEEERHVGEQVLKECKSTDDLKDFLEKPKTEPDEAEKPYLHLFVFRRRKDGADEFWTTEEDFKGLSDIARLRATAEWFPMSVRNKVINVKEKLDKMKEELNKMTEKDRGALKLEKGINGIPKGELIEFFQDPERYVKGAVFEVDDAASGSSEYFASRNEHNNMTRVLCHSKTEIDVWVDAVDLRSGCTECDGKDGCRCFKVLFHYTKTLAFGSITSAHKKFHELWCSYGKRAHFGDGLYASQYAPEHFGSKLRVALNNYGSCDTDPFSDEPLCCPKYWEDIRTHWAVEAADFCIPILVPKELLRNFKDEDKKGKFKAGCNHNGVKQHDGRDVWIISPPDNDSRNVMSGTTQRLELLRMRQENKKVSPLGRMQAFADAAHILFQQGDLAEAAQKFEEALKIQKSREKTSFGLSLVQAYALCLRKQDTYESKQKAKDLLKEHGVASDADSGSMLQSLDHASWRHQGLDEHFKAFYDSWKQGDLAVAQNRLDQFESLLKQLPGEKDRDLNTLKTYRAAVFSDQGNMEKAESLLKEVLESREKSFGEKHMETLACHDLLARLFLNWRRFKDAEEHAQKALDGRDPDKKKSDHLNVLRSRSFLQEIRIEKAQSEESSLSEKIFEEAFETMQDCARKMLPQGEMSEPEFVVSGFEDHRAALAMWSNAACVAKRFAALPHINEEKKMDMLQKAANIYKQLYTASKEPVSWDHAVHHARIACNRAHVLDLDKSTKSENPMEVLEEAKKTIQKFIDDLKQRKSADSQPDGSPQASPEERPFRDDQLLDQGPCLEDLPLEFLILDNNLAFLKYKSGDLILKNPSGTVPDGVGLLKEAKELYTKSMEELKGKLERHATQQDNAAQQEAYSAAMTLGEILLKLMDQGAYSDEERRKFQEDASQNFKYAADNFEKLLGKLNVKSVACRHSYASVRLQQGGTEHWREAMKVFEAVADSWEEVNMGGAAASMLQESLDLKQDVHVKPELLRTLMRARALFSAASASKAIWLAPAPGKAAPTPQNLEEICQKFEVVLNMKDLGMDEHSKDQVFQRLKGIFAMAHAELGQLHGKEYQETKNPDQFHTTEKHFKAALEWLPQPQSQPPAEEEVQLLRCRTHFNSACLQLTALQYADVSTWEKVSEDFRGAADGYDKLIKSGRKCRCQGVKEECFYYQRAMCKFNLIKAISMQRNWQAVKAQHKEFEVLINELEARKGKGCAAPDENDLKKWKAELARNLRRPSITKEGSKASQVAPEIP